MCWINRALGQAAVGEHPHSGSARGSWAVWEQLCGGDGDGGGGTSAVPGWDSLCPAGVGPLNLQPFPMVHFGRATRGSALVYFLILNQTSEAQRCPTASAKCLRAHGAGGGHSLSPSAPSHLLCCAVQPVTLTLNGVSKSRNLIFLRTPVEMSSVIFFFNVFVLSLGFEGPLPTWDMHRIFQNSLGLKGTNNSDQTPQKPPETSTEDI